MVIKEVHIENFKKFNDLKVGFESLDCLVGGNNSGKTTLLQALALFDFVVHNCLSWKNLNGDGHHKLLEIKNRSISPEEFVVLPVANAIDLWTDKISQRSGKHVIISINVTFSTDQSAKATIDLNFNRFSIGLHTENSQEWLVKLAEFKISYLPVFSSFLTQEEKRTPAVIEDALARGRVNSVIRNLLFNLKQENKIEELEIVLQRSIPTFKNLHVEFDEITDRFIEVAYNEEGRKKKFDLFMAGSGFQQFVYLFGFIGLRNPNVVLLDEPDVHLHGNLQGALLEELKILVQNGKQVIFATHSKDLITRLDPENILSLIDDKPNRLQIKYDLFDTLESLGSIDNIQVAQIQAFRNLLVVENIDDWKYLTIFGRKILGEARWQLIEKRLAVCPAKGNPYKQDISKLKDQLTGIFSLGTGGKPLKIFVIADLDYYPYWEELVREKNEKSPDIYYYIWKRNEIENYLLVFDSIKRLVSDKSGDFNLFHEPLRKTFNELIENDAEKVKKRIGEGLEYYQNTKKKGWNISRIMDEISLIMQERWELDKLSLVDAKEHVLPGVKRWLQENGFRQFSDLALAESFEVAEIDPEIVEVINKIGRFVSVVK